ncbi:MAG TPA: type II secretion system protein [Candidatus Saccharibacteria bacterium]|nr:type II secretion system protein [Candidatus Saccharibacteria bacterium]HRK93927.1 type II secretion system protein [Candidatus Saccharibacteria bacterium]
MNRGFTVVEILVTLVIMAILLTLGVVSMRSVQASARDQERQSDVETIARGLEQRYNRGNPVITATTDPNEAKAGSYPGVNEMIHMTGDFRSGYTPDTVPGGYLYAALPGTSPGSFSNPAGQNIWTIVCVWACSPAGNSAQISSAFGGSDKYVYEPVDVNGNICCCGNCNSFNLYWKSETDSTVVNGIAGLKTVKSLHR